MIVAGTAPQALAAAVNLGTTPLFLGASVPPIVMLTLPRDHQLAMKAFNDYTDLDGDGSIETTYKHLVDYYGYFDAFKCYTYNNGNGRFDPAAATTDKYCNASATGQWSGNFLNWLTMSRLDIVRKILYGGKRSQDDTTTVLERALIPPDGHAWAKHYVGDDIGKLTPFSSLLTSNAAYASTSNVTIGTGSKTFATSTATNAPSARPLLVGDQVRVEVTGSPTLFMVGTVTAVAASSVTVDAQATGGAGTSSTWTLTNLSSSGVSFCNLTDSGDTGVSETLNTSTYPPVIRAVAGNYGLWAVTDGKNCRWSDENGGGNSNGNQGGLSGLAANSKNPVRTTVGLNVSSVTNAAYSVRAKVCDSTLLGQEKCQQYDDGSWKPVGLLQDYSSAYTKRIRFGLMMGSFDTNKSGGVLRRAAGFLDGGGSGPFTSYTPVSSDEINPKTGRFTGNNGIIKTLNNLRVFGFNFAAGGAYKYNGDGDGCDSPGVLDPAQGTCTSWGNPISEIYTETLRYLAGKTTPTAAFSPASHAKDDQLGLSPKVTWSDPLSSTAYCTPLNVVVMNASVNSYDDDAVPTDLFPSGTTAQTLTKTLGTDESLTGTYLVANNGVTNNDLCTAKTLAGSNGLGSVTGVCPEGPILKGTYSLSGVAYWAHTNRIRSDLTVPANDKKSLKATTYGVALATNVPKITIPVPGSSTRTLTILPNARTLNSGSYRGPGSIMDFKLVSQDIANGRGSFYVSWEDSQQGNDYDLDMWGIINYCIQNASTPANNCPSNLTGGFAGNNTITVSTKVVYAAAGFTLGFGYVLSGSENDDGPHFHSAHKGNTQFDYSFTNSGTTPVTVTECSDCKDADPFSFRTYAIPTTTAPSVGLLQEPLWYAAKYGAFRDPIGDGKITSQNQWDEKNNRTGAIGAGDGIPDGYFLAINPKNLEDGLDQAFIAVLQNSSASSVATNSTSLNTGSRVYQARFNSSDWSGQLVASSLRVDGTLDPDPLWDAGQRMAQPFAGASNRVIISYNRAVDTTVTPHRLTGSPNAAAKGIPFQWADVSGNEIYASYLNKDASGTTDSQGQKRVDYLRGDQSNEGATSTKFRVRPTSVLGDIVNSTPIFVGGPTRFFFDSTYVDFRREFAARKPSIYVGANDGMLHAFNADPTDPTTGTTGTLQGQELLAYVPSMSYPNLSRLTDRLYSGNHRYFVDGSPTVGDVCFGTNSNGSCPDKAHWHTMLVGGLNAGGKGYYALDITDPTGAHRSNVAFSATNAANIVLWEFTSRNDPELGFSYSKPTVARMNNGKWAVIVGNGYDNSVAPAALGSTSAETTCTAANTPAGCSTSVTGKAYLFIIFVDGPSGSGGTWVEGTDYVKIPASLSGEAVNAATPNGLAEPIAADEDGDDKIDFIYAGDLLGRLWKFDVRSATSSSWSAADGQPLFIATTPNATGTGTVPQPITSAPEATIHPNGGIMVLFGTGRYLQQSDDSNPFDTQSLYGIWDKKTKILNDTSASQPVSKSELMPQTVLGTVTVGTDLFRITTAHKPNYSATDRSNTLSNVVTDIDTEATTTANQRGWYLDFPQSGDQTSGTPAVTVAGTGEKLVFRPVLSGGKLVANTLIPSNQACDAGGSGFTMELDPITGGRLAASPIDVNGDFKFSSADLVTFSSGGTSFSVAVSGKKSTIGIIPTPTIVEGARGTVGGSTTSTCGVGCEVKVLSGSSGQLGTIREKSGTAAGARILWREMSND